MLLNITLHKPQAADLGYLLGKHPDRVQEFELPRGKLTVFYPVVEENRATASIYIELDPVQLVRGGGKKDRFSLDQYVNDRPYTANSYLANALSAVFGSSLNGKTQPAELVEQAFDFEVELHTLKSPGGEETIRRLFEPLGYQVELRGFLLDEQWPEWGQSPYFSLRLRGTVRMMDLLRHLYVLVPALDNAKHYFLGNEEVKKLIAKGEGWLDRHPEAEFITRRYLRHRRSMVDEAMSFLQKEEATEGKEAEPAKDAAHEASEGKPVHQHRLETVRDKLKSLPVSTVADLGCGEGKFLRLLRDEPQFTRILGMDVSHRALEWAEKRLSRYGRPDERIRLIQGALTYRDKRIEGFDAAVLIEVIEHLDPPRLAALEQAVFRHATPQHVIVTTPNVEYNALFENLPAGKFRHDDHRFEWSREEFRQWCEQVGEAYGYTFVIEPLGQDLHPEFGALSQLALFIQTPKSTKP